MRRHHWSVVYKHHVWRAGSYICVCGKPSGNANSFFSVSCCGVFPVSTPETDYGTSRREDFWFIVAARSEDEAEIRVGQSAGRASSEGHSASDPPAVFGGREDPHRAGRAAR